MTKFLIFRFSLAFIAFGQAQEPKALSNETNPEWKAFAGLPEFKNKERLVFAPAKYPGDLTLLDYQIDFCQLSYEIYRIQR